MHSNFSYDFSFVLHFFLSPLVIFHGRQITQWVWNHCQGWPFLWKSPICRVYIIVHVFQCVFMWLHLRILQNWQKKIINIFFNDNIHCQGHSLPFSLRKAAALEKKIHFPKVKTESPMLLFYFVPVHLHLVLSARSIFLHSLSHQTSSSYQPVTSYHSSCLIFYWWEETELLWNHGLAHVLHAVPSAWWHWFQVMWGYRPEHVICF